MPRYGSSDIPHTASTDHRILRRKETGGARKDSLAAPASPAAGSLRPDEVLMSFYRDRQDVDRTELSAIGHWPLCGWRLMDRLPPHARSHTFSRRWKPRSSATRAICLPARRAATPWDCQAGPRTRKAPSRRSSLGHRTASLALVGAAAMAETLGQTEAALDYWRRGVAANPWSPEYRRRFALLLVKREAWPEALAECDGWVRLDPLSTEARTARVSCLLATGKKDEARAEFGRVEALAPANLSELQIRFGRKLK